MLRELQVGPIDISGWSPDEDHPVFPVGSKPKRMVIAPANVAPPLIAGHSYLFKTAADWRQQQIWSEIVAAQLAALVGVPVPPCFISVDGSGADVGALIEFFYGYPGEVPAMRLAHGSDFLTALYPSAKQRGRPHAVRLNIGICRRFVPDRAIEWWGKVLTFDALIGNVDRHTENWGLVGRLTARGHERLIAPAFDNGTSLGYEKAEAAIASSWSKEAIKSYIDKGRHHCSWDVDDETVRGHFDLCHRYIIAYPEAGKAMRSVIRFDRSQITAITEWCSRTNVGIPFTSARARFVTELIEARQARLRAVLGEGDD